jgi:hypothetical protein
VRGRGLTPEIAPTFVFLAAPSCYQRQIPGAEDEDRRAISKHWFASLEIPLFAIDDRHRRLGLLGRGQELASVICDLAPPVMKWDIIGRPTIVETGNAPNPLGRDRIGVEVTLLGSEMSIAIDDRHRVARGALGRAYNVKRVWR